jgi:hypothetical protein
VVQADDAADDDQRRRRNGAREVNSVASVATTVQLRGATRVRSSPPGYHSAVRQLAQSMGARPM